MNSWRTISVIVSLLLGVVIVISFVGLKVQASHIDTLERRLIQSEQDWAELKRQRKLAYPLAEDDL